MIVTDWDKYAHFNKSEFDCKETGENEMQSEFLDRLSLLRIKFAKPMFITSGYRSVNHSVERKKERPGTHTHGIACDIRVSGFDKYRLVKMAFEQGFSGVGIAKSFVHLDISKTRKAIWSY